MGWGLLFFGYFLEFILGMNSYLAPFVHVPGWAMMYAGLAGLQRYCKSFRFAKWCAIALAVLSVWRTFAEVQSSFGVTFGFLLDGITTAVTWTSFALVLLFHTLLAISVEQLAKRVSLPKNATRAVRNLVVVYFYGALYIAQVILQTAVLAPVTIITRLVWAICNCVLLYSCYMRIAPADQADDAPRPPSRFAFVNRLRAAFDEREQKAIEADRTYHAENARKRREKQLDRMSSKQRAKEEARERNRNK